MNTRAAGFSLLEILVVVSIVAILAGVLLVNFSDTSASGRDAKRQADLRMLQNAIEQYKNKHGRYPAGCQGNNQWGGGSYGCIEGGTDYVRGHAPGINFVPDFVRVLPRDPKWPNGPSGSSGGYVYVTNGDGSVYKLMAMNVVESEIVSPTHEFGSCPMAANSAGTAHLNGINGYQAGGWCSAVTNQTVVSMGGQNIGFGPNIYFSSETVTVSTCLYAGASNRYDKSYGVWGGVHKDTIERIEGIITPNTVCPSDTEKFDSRTIQPIDSSGALISPIVTDANEWRCRARTIRATAGIICK